MQLPNSSHIHVFHVALLKKFIKGGIEVQPTFPDDLQEFEVVLNSPQDTIDTESETPCKRSGKHTKAEKFCRVNIVSWKGTEKEKKQQI